MENKTYKITTIKELTKMLTKENTERFKIDFIPLLEQFCEIKNTLGDNKLFLDRITWIDDKKEEVVFDFNSKLD